MHNIRKLRRNLDYTSILTIRLEMVRKSETEQMLFLVLLRRVASAFHGM